MKFTGELAHDEIVQALIDFVKRNHPNHTVNPAEWAVIRDDNGRLCARFVLEFPTSKAAFGNERKCSLCSEAGHNAATCWRNGTPTPAPNV
jgi:hypothetical protein